MNKVPASVWKNPWHFAAFGFGSGAAPFAPGTFGTLAAVLLYLPLQYLHWFSYLLVVVVAFAIGVVICERTSRDIGVHDHGGIVWDEFVGFWIAMLFAPAGWIWIVLGFVLFRVFDIAKPAPIGWLDRKVKGGMGIMVDDVVAGFYALLCLQLLARIFQG